MTLILTGRVARAASRSAVSIRGFSAIASRGEEREEEGARERKQRTASPKGRLDVDRNDMSSIGLVCSQQKLCTVATESSFNLKMVLELGST